MEAFLTTSLEFPTLVYSVLLGVCVVSWLIAATGMAEIDGLDLAFDAEPDGIAGILGRLGLNGVPLMLVLTLVVFFAWVATYFVHLLVLAHVPGPLRWLLGAGVALLALPPAILATAAALRPLRRRLLLLRPPTEVSLLGHDAPGVAGQGVGDQHHALDSNTWSVVPERDYEHL